MKILHKAVAGSLESSDVLISVEPADEGLSINIESVVLKQWGARIRQVVEESMQAAGISQARIDVRDHGALECTLKARIETVLLRAGR
ncbi:MAG TPA: citrate lyase acyl carrier protein [Candidatus Avidesulfovibrio excrementigallinarum]|nr:citrate lyase acyl carrier protein [Candidatus Avidesulfovibrio excrementigallinarum]